MGRFITANRIIKAGFTVIGVLAWVVIVGLFSLGFEWLFGPVEEPPEGVMLAFATIGMAGLVLVLVWWWGAKR